MLKKLFFILFVSFSAVAMAAVDDNAVLLTIDGEPALASEFIYIYNKNNTDSAIEHKTMDEYMEMFINYKLKVHEAKQLGLDTTQAFEKELQGYRKQIVPPYLTDSTAEKALIDEAYNRRGEDIAVSHIAIQCPMNASAADTLAAYNKIALARQRVTTGIERREGKKVLPLVVEDFEAVAREVSEDPSVSENGGYLGWVIPFRYVLPFENAAYNTAQGHISEIFRSPFGYHILRVEQRLPHKEVRAAHIMKMTPRNDNQAQMDSINRVAEDGIKAIYAKLTDKEHPADFAETARTESEDRGSAANGGNLNWFGRGMMVPEFETVAFALADSGAISGPFRSQYGWHIVEKLGERGLQPKEELHNELQRNVRRDERYRKVEASFVKKLKERYNYAEYSEALRAFYDVAGKCAIDDSLFYQVTSQLDGTLFTFADQKRTQRDFAEYIKANPRTNLGIADKIIDEKFRHFVNQQLIAYEESQLENEYPEFRNLMTEYHDGILLFDVALDNVWNKATQDTAGLRRYFNEHKKSYTFKEPRYKGYVLYCKDEATLKAAKTIIKNANPDSISSYFAKRLNIDSVPSVKYEKGIWKAGQNKAVDKYGFKLKTAEYEPSAELPLVCTIGKVIKAPTEYNDVRGDVTAHYQDYLEAEWIKELRAKYPVVVNEQVFEEVKRENK